MDKLIFNLHHFASARRHDVVAAILVFQHGETTAKLRYQTNPVVIELFSYVNNFYCSMATGHVSEYGLYLLSSRVKPQHALCQEPITLTIYSLETPAFPDRHGNQRWKSHYTPCTSW